MFNIGIIELIIVVFFVVLFVRPEEIPKISKNLGLLYRKITRYYYNLKFELDEVNEIEHLKKNIDIKSSFEKKKLNIKKKNKKN
jgi:Sec-independent protein translocase protein TatA